MKVTHIGSEEEKRRGQIKRHRKNGVFLKKMVELFPDEIVQEIQKLKTSEIKNLLSEIVFEIIDMKKD